MHWNLTVQSPLDLQTTNACLVGYKHKKDNRKDNQIVMYMESLKEKMQAKGGSSE